MQVALFKQINIYLFTHSSYCKEVQHFMLLNFGVLYLFTWNALRLHYIMQNKEALGQFWPWWGRCLYLLTVTNTHVKVALIGVLRCQGDMRLPARLSHIYMSFCPHLSLGLTAASVVRRPNKRVCVCYTLTCSCVELWWPYGQRIAFRACMNSHGDVSRDVY